MNFPQHPFIDYKPSQTFHFPYSEESHQLKNFEESNYSTQTNEIKTNKEQILTKEMFLNLQLKPISHQQLIEKKKQLSKPKEIEETKDKQYPKIRVSLNVFEKLKKFQKVMKCKSYCEVVMKLFEYYEGHDVSIINKSDEQ